LFGDVSFSDESIFAGGTVPQINDYRPFLANMESWLKKQSHIECAAVFDIGTRAARVLVGPKNPVETSLWHDKLFASVGFVPDIGADTQPISHILNVDESPGLIRLRDFINDTMNVLHRNGVQDTNVVAIATQVFRAMPLSNQAEVMAWIKQQTGLTVEVINGVAEAGLSLTAANYTQEIGLNDESLKLIDKNGDRLLLIDQGGGSTEISFVTPPTGATRSSKEGLGTTTLRRMFFGGLTGKDEKSDFSSIPEQYQRILVHIQKQVETFTYLQPGDFKLAYGLGTAITDCVPIHRRSEKHNKVLTTEMILRVEQKCCSELTACYPNVAALSDELESLQRTDEDRYVKATKEVMFLYGLPVFRMILQKAGFSELRLCGYPLRFGAFIVWHWLKLDWNNQPRVLSDRNKDANRT
jgi:exopolyphosphatase/pppGpp-phosphohydrolase